MLRRFYSGGEDFVGLHPMISGHGDIDARENAAFPIAGTDAVLRVGKYGPYLDSGGGGSTCRPSWPPDELTAAKVAELEATRLSARWGSRRTAGAASWPRWVATGLSSPRC